MDAPAHFAKTCNCYYTFKGLVAQLPADWTMADAPTADGPRGRVRETYHAAIQHDLVDLTGEERLVGVVRRPTPWFAGAVDENRPALGPPGDLLDEVKARTEDLKLQGLCEEGAHNAAFEEVDFDRRYREHLETSEDAEAAMAELLAAVEDGEDVVLVCFEADDKLCHRHVLKAVLEIRLDAA